MQERIFDDFYAESGRLCDLKEEHFSSRVYSKFYKPIYKYVKKHVNSQIIAEELTQDIFLKIFQNRFSYDPTFALPSWIWTIAKNTVFDYLRKLRSNSLSQVQSLDELAQRSCFEPMSEVTAESLMIEKTDRSHLKNLLNQLSKRQREAIFLRLVKRFSYKEISSAMNLSLSAVKSLINRGKTTLISISQAAHPPLPENPEHKQKGNPTGLNSEIRRDSGY